LSNFTARTASLALALIALPLTAAQAQPSVRIGDLNLASDAGQAAFAHRLNVAAEQVCGAEKNFSIQYACQAGVRAEVTEKLAAITPATQFAAVPAAHVQPSVRIADLNLASTAGKAAFAHRVNVAAAVVCGNEKNLSIAYACKAAVRAEVSEKLAMISPATQLAVR
jgi:UrcA family protein